MSHGFTKKYSDGTSHTTLHVARPRIQQPFLDISLEEFGKSCIQV